MHRLWMLLLTRQILLAENGSDAFSVRSLFGELDVEGPLAAMTNFFSQVSRDCLKFSQRPRPKFCRATDR